MITVAAMISAAPEAFSRRREALADGARINPERKERETVGNSAMSVTPAAKLASLIDTG